MINPVHELCSSGEAHDAKSTPLSWTVRELLRVTAAAISATMVCSPLLLASRPKTPLRVCCIAAFEFLARLQGRTLGKRRRLAMAHACDFGSLCDDYYDHQRLDAAHYRQLRCELRLLAPEAATSHYLRRLREAERSRPTLSAGQPGLLDAVIAYRISVLDLSLRWMEQISDATVDATDFNVLLNLVGLMQIADDALDWEEDQAGGCPSYVTALLLDQPETGVVTRLRAEADALLRSIADTARQNVAATPFAVAGILTWALVVMLLKVRFPQGR